MRDSPVRMVSQNQSMRRAAPQYVRQRRCRNAGRGRGNKITNASVCFMIHLWYRKSESASEIADSGNDIYVVVAVGCWRGSRYT